MVCCFQNHQSKGHSYLPSEWIRESIFHQRKWKCFGVKGDRYDIFPSTTFGSWELIWWFFHSCHKGVNVILLISLRFSRSVSLSIICPFYFLGRLFTGFQKLEVNDESAVFFLTYNHHKLIAILSFYFIWPGVLTHCLP